MSSPVDEPAWRRAIEDVCAELGWKARAQNDRDRTLVICPLPKDKRLAGALFVVAPSLQRLTVSISYRTKVPPGKWGVMAEAAMRINAGLLGGCLEADQRGEVRYRDGL